MLVLRYKTVFLSDRASAGFFGPIWPMATCFCFDGGLRPPYRCLWRGWVAGGTVAGESAIALAKVFWFFFAKKNIIFWFGGGVGGWRHGCREGRDSAGKSFLVLFFKKERLPAY
jgi:hypothetical protein